MQRIFWVSCPKCGGKFYCDYELRFKEVKLICPLCENHFHVHEGSVLYND